MICNDAGRNRALGVKLYHYRMLTNDKNQTAQILYSKTICLDSCLHAIFFRRACVALNFPNLLKCCNSNWIHTNYSHNNWCEICWMFYRESIQQGERENTKNRAFKTCCILLIIFFLLVSVALILGLVFGLRSDGKFHFFIFSRLHQLGEGDK